MDINKFVNDKIKALKLVSEVDRKDFKDKDELFDLILNSIKYETESIVARYKECKEEEIEVYNNRLEYENFKFNVQEFFNCNFKHILYFISSDSNIFFKFKEINKENKSDFLLTLSKFLIRYSRTLQLRYLEHLITYFETETEVYWDEYTIERVVILTRCNNKNITVQEKFEFLLKLKFLNLREVFYEIGYNNELFKHCIRNHKEIDKEIRIPVNDRLHPKWDNFKFIYETIKFINSEKITHSKYYGHELVPKKGWAYYSDYVKKVDDGYNFRGMYI